MTPPETITGQEATEMAEAEAQRAAAAEENPPAPAEPDPEALAAGGRTVPKDKAATQYHVVACLLGEIPDKLRENPAVEKLRAGNVPLVPFILGGHKAPEVFETTGGPQGAKRLALNTHPELAACVCEPGIALATWPARSYEFKPVEVQPQPDKWVV